MGISLETLVERLMQAVPARDGVPTLVQYRQCIEDAVADLDQRKPNQKVAAMSVVAGTAEYALPSDFVRLIALEPLWAAEGVLVGDGGLIAVDAMFTELVTVAGGVLTITPTPGYTAVRRLYYAAGRTLDADEVYVDLTPGDARLVLLLAQALALEAQANTAAAAGWRYQIGDEMVDKSGLGSGLLRQAQALRAQYEAAVTASIGPYGVRGGGGWAEMSTRVCRHCGRVYRGLACPCRKEAARRRREVRQQEEMDRAQDADEVRVDGLSEVGDDETAVRDA